MKKSAKIIIGLGFGDEGKGTMVSYFCQNQGYDTVVFYNGGAQRGHNVVTDDGIHHTFSQIGSGSFTPGVKTILSEYTLFNPLNLMCEAKIFSDKIGENILNRVFIDENTPIITYYHVTMNQIKEIYRSNNRHGSCGQGIGELAYDLINFPDEVIRAGELKNKEICEDKLIKIRSRKLKEFSELDSDIITDQLKSIYNTFIRNDYLIDTLSYYKDISENLNIVPSDILYKMIREGNPIFEGGQGVLLDEIHGFAPYNTWTNILPDNAFKILEASNFDGDIETIGVIRTYYTRHGAGPFPSENDDLRKYIIDKNNPTNQFQGDLRLGYFDDVLFRYAIVCCGGYIDSIALTHTDALETMPLNILKSYTLTEEHNNIAKYRINPEFITKNSKDTINHIECITIESVIVKDESLNYMINHINNIRSYNIDPKVKYISFGPKISQKKEIV